ncbi:MAG: trypsin-like serine protease [Sphingobacteriales bacterium]|nr:MAG: trypsin-like serine protease [Sphingobacteriales bacterium]
MTRILICLFLCLSIPAVQAIIYRHDVAEEEYRKLALQPQFNCVGQIFESRRSPIGSCVLISDRFVLTAAHVFMKSDQVPDTMFMQDGKLIKEADLPVAKKGETVSWQRLIVYKHINVRVGEAESYEFRFNRRRYKAKQIIIFPEYNDSTIKEGADLALVELEEAVTDVKPAALNTDFDEIGSRIVNVGFGVSGNAAKPEDVDMYFSKLAGENMVDTSTGRLYAGRPSVLQFDFDHPSLKQYNVIGSDTPLPLEHVCGGGDSGGGMFRQKGKEWELAGICSRTAIDINLLTRIGYYGHTAGYTRVSVFQDWIRKHL